jgi:hypothetical protein
MSPTLQPNDQAATATDIVTGQSHNHEDPENEGNQPKPEPATKVIEINEEMVKAKSSRLCLNNLSLFIV